MTGRCEHVSRERYEIRMGRDSPKLLHDLMVSFDMPTAQHGSAHFNLSPHLSLYVLGDHVVFAQAFEHQNERVLDRSHACKIHLAKVTWG